MSSPAEKLTTTAGDYWQHHHADDSQFFGVYPMGKCGQFEVYYRHYLEVKHFLKQAPLSKDMTILDLGCGSGRWALALAPLVKKYTGVDISTEALQNAATVVNRLGITNIQFVNSSLTSYLPTEKISMVYLSSVTQYLEDDEVREVLKNLSDHISENSRLVDRSTINYRNREVLATDGYYVIYRTPQEIRALFGEFGWKCDYQKRSYRFMRGAPLITNWHVQRVLLKSLSFAGPLVFQLARAFSWCCDTVNPAPFEGGDRSHDFFVFHR